MWNTRTLLLRNGRGEREIRYLYRRSADLLGARRLTTMRKSAGSALFVITVSALPTACRQDMHDQPRYKPYAASDFWNDGRSARPLPEGTVARGQLRADSALYRGKDGQAFTLAFPIPIDESVLRRGQQRFNVYCSPCHGRTGAGNGVVVQRGFKQPVSLHIERLRLAPAGYIFDVISNGFGAMQDYSAQVEVNDRWAIVAYVRALQYSQNAPIGDVPAEKRAALAQGGKSGTTEPTPAEHAPASAEGHP